MKLKLYDNPSNSREIFKSGPKWWTTNQQHQQLSNWENVTVTAETKACENSGHLSRIELQTIIDDWERRSKLQNWSHDSFVSPIKTKPKFILNNILYNDINHFVWNSSWDRGNYTKCPFQTAFQNCLLAVIFPLFSSDEQSLIRSDRPQTLLLHVDGPFMPSSTSACISLWDRKCCDLSAVSGLELSWEASHTEHNLKKWKERLD